MVRVTYISWAPHCSRSDFTARELGGTSHMIYWGWLGSHPATVLLKYLGQAFSTWRVLLAERPDVVFVMSPPPIAILPVYLYALVTGRRFVVDAHTGVFLTDRWRHFQRFQFWLCRRAATTIVTNAHLAALLRSHGASATIVPDVPGSQATARSDRRTQGPFTAVFVTSFDRDEPIAAMVEAARLVPEVAFVMTGDTARAGERMPASLPPNLRLSGFLPTDDYRSLIGGAGVVVALTSDDHTTQRAAWEAVYQETPVIVTDTALLREEFATGALHVTNTPEAIAAAVGRVRDERPAFEAGARTLRQRKLERWEGTKAGLLAALGAPESSGRKPPS